MTRRVERMSARASTRLELQQTGNGIAAQMGLRLAYVQTTAAAPITAETRPGMTREEHS